MKKMYEVKRFTGAIPGSIGHQQASSRVENIASAWLAEKAEEGWELHSWVPVDQITVDVIAVLNVEVKP